MLLPVVNQAVEDRMRAWLAPALDESSTWRLGKAEEYPDDPRNSNSMVALSSAAGYVRDKGKHGRGIYQMTELVAACDQIGHNLTEYGFAGPQSERRAGRYGFDRGAPPLDDASHNQLLEDLFVASLEDLRELFEDGDEYAIPAGSRFLAEMIAEHLPARPVSPEETSIALLTEIRDLLKERLPEVGQA
jgi:hypothetical protein